MNNARVITVDGGVATGKSRLVSELAQLLRLKGYGVVHVSSGHIYRAVAVVALEMVRPRVNGRRGQTEAQINKACFDLFKKMDMAVILEAVRHRELALHGGEVWLDEAPVAEERLKAPSIGMATSWSSANPAVREMVNAVVQRQIDEFDGYVLIDGRDIGREVVPGAPLKLFLTVEPVVAAQRSPEHTLVELVERDTADRNRPHGALLPAADAIILPTDEHTPESVRDHAYRLMRGVFGELPPL